MTLTDFSFLEQGRRWPPLSEKARIDRYDRCRLLFEGDHEAAFPGLTATDADLAPITVNWFKRATTLIADLASPVRIFADNQEVVDRILDQTSFDLLVYDIFVDILRFGNAVLKIRFDPNRGGIVERIDPRYWFPVVSPDDGRDIQAHVIAYDFAQIEDHIEQGYLRAEIHRPGVIENRLYRLDSGRSITAELPISALERYSGLESEVPTGVDDFLVQPVAGLLSADGVFGLDDYRNFESLVREIEKRLIRTSRTLDKFADPNLLIPVDEMSIDPATGEPLLTNPYSGNSIFEDLKIGGGRYIVAETGETGTRPLPAYLTWDASLQSSFAQIAEIKSQMLAVAEISPALLGDARNGLAESGSALKRLAIPTLAKVARLRSRVRRPILRALAICAELERASRYPGSAPLENLSIEWLSSLPPDPVESAQVEQLRKTAGLTSTRSALARLDPDATEEDLAWEEAKIAEEQREASYNFI